MKQFLSKLSIVQISIGAALITALIAGTFYLSQTSSSDTGEAYVEKKIDSKFSEYISAYTSGDISIQSKIKIRFIKTGIETNKEIRENNLFEFSPSIDGDINWIDDYTVEFTPKEWMKADQIYDVSFDLAKMYPQEKGLKDLTFNFHTLAQDFEIITGDLITAADNMKKVSLTGSLITADVSKKEAIENLLSATQDGAKLEINWSHIGATEHEYTITNINRLNTESKVILTWDGNVIGVDKKDTKNIKIPALGDFKALSCEANQATDQHFVIAFSDPIEPNQDLTGLITSDNNVTFKFTIENNFIRAYPNKKINGTVNITVHAGIKNVLGFKMKGVQKFLISFEQIKPAVRLIGKGVIVPSSKGLIFPFEAISLRAVDITITEIFENNVIQFFQNNNIDGQSQLRRVAKPIFKKSLKLNRNRLLNLNKWNRFSIDLAELITPTPGAIYQVEIGFRQSQSNYSCGSNTIEDEMTEINEDSWSADAYTEYSYWDYEDDYDYDYDWTERDNPCNSSYYSSSRRNVKRNIISSNLGIISKIGKDRKIFIAITDINTTQPIENVAIEVYDFQQQLITTGNTDKNGFLTLDTESKPFLIKATNNKDVNYLKVDNASALSLSNFNVAGSTVEKGLKGFIYGERGVWRPGDTLFLSFILEDKNNILPNNHPVVFELRNPDGKVEDRTIKNINVNGFYTYQPTTDDEAMTGNWSVKVKVGNTVFSERVKIEAIKPNHLKIKLDYGKEYLTVEDENKKGDLEVTWLHGGIAKNLKTEFELVLTKGATKFEKFNSYIFEDQSKRFTPEIVKIFEGELDENGKAQIPATININGQAPGVLNAHFKGKVFENSGDFSVNQFSIPYYPYKTFVGLKTPEGDRRGMLLTDEKHTVDIVCLSPEGKLKGDRYVKVQVYKLDWKWWWDQSSNSSSNYIGVNYQTPVSEQNVKLTQGKGQYQMEVKYPTWGRFYVKVTDIESNHSAGKIVYFDWPGWAGKARRDSPDAASMLTFSSDKEKYSVDETMKLSIPGSGEGNALISIENGTKVLESYWMPLKKGENAFEIKVNKNMTPNVYVHVTAIQPHAQTINDHPIRMYGVIPIDIEDENTHLLPVIDMPKVLTPGKNVPIKITEENGKAMTFTLAVVDEGLLSLTNFKTPNPWPHFYKHEALGVNTWDIYKYVMGAYGGEIEEIVAVGGDGSIKNQDDEKVKRFKPVVRFFGPFHIDVASQKEINFIMPNYIGAVRTMVIAGHDGAYGSAEKETPVRQSLMVMGTLPRVLSPGEKLKLPVNVFAYENNIGKTTVKIKTSGPLKALETTKIITFSKKGDEMVYFDMEVTNAIGVSKVELIATAGDRKSTQIIDIEIRNPNPFITEAFEKVLNPGESLDYSFKTLGMKGTNSYAIEGASVPPLNLSERLSYLLRYPHGCIEQTTSGAFPQLFLGELTDLTDEEKAKVEINIKKAIERIGSMQLSNGGFGYWPNSDKASDWGSTYAGHFLITAKKKGYFVSQSVISDWEKYQKNEARNWSPTSYYNNELLQAYRLYTLALANKAEQGAMNRLKEKTLNKTSQYMLAASYALTGRNDIATLLIASAPPTVKNYREYWYSYGSTYRDESMLLLALNAIKDTESGMVAVKKISKRLNNVRWLSTQETSFALLSISEFMLGQPLSTTVNMDFTVDAKTTAISSRYALYKEDFNEDDIQNKTVTITNTSNGILYVNLSSTGQPLKDLKESSNEVIEMDISYSDKDGNAINLDQISQNKDVLVSVKIKNNGLRGDLKEMALTTLFPSGWEIQNTRMDVVAAHYQSDIPDYQDFRDDRVLTYFDINSGDSKTFNFLINASYAGKFTLPAIKCEAMYDNAVQAYKKGGITETVK